MRITTEMLNASAKRAGISWGGTSLLNYISGGTTQTTQSSLLNALQTTQNNTVSKTQRANYEKLEESADLLATSLHTLLTEQEGTEQKIYDAVEQMVDNYNGTIKALKNVSTPLNDFYKEMLEEAVTESEAALNEFGITKNKNGTLSLEKEKFESSDLETIKKVFGNSGTFSTKVAFIAGRISENATANMESYSSLYGADGYSNIINSSKYEFWG